VIGRWFEVVDGELMLNAEGARWRDQHEAADIEDRALRDTLYVITKRREGRWTLKITFELQAGRGREAIAHDFFVELHGKPSGIGAQVGELRFEPFVLLNGD
jgi:hypothetical protein